MYSWYISIGKPFYHKVPEIAEFLLKINGGRANINYHRIGNSYSPELMMTSNAVAVHIPEDGIIGKGVFTELMDTLSKRHNRLAIIQGNLFYLVPKLHIEELPGNNYQRYARVTIQGFFRSEQIKSKKLVIPDNEYMWDKMKIFFI